MTNEARQDHDQRFKLLIETFLRSFCMLFFEWANRINWDFPVEWLRTEVFLNPPQGKRRYLDMVAKVKLHDPIPYDNVTDSPSAMVLLHIEIESGDSAAAIARRMYEYSRALEHHGLPIIPVVFLMSVGYDGLGEEIYCREGFGKQLLTFRCWRVGLPALDADDYLFHAERLGTVLALMMRSSRPRPAMVADALRHIVDGPDLPAHKFLLCEAVDAYANLQGNEQTEFLRLLESQEYQGVKAMNKTTFERGIEEGRREMTLKLIRRKFGELFPKVQEKILAMTATEIDSFFERLLDANSLADLDLQMDDQ